MNYFRLSDFKFKEYFDYLHFEAPGLHVLAHLNELYSLVFFNMQDHNLFDFRSSLYNRDEFHEIRSF